MARTKKSTIAGVTIGYAQVEPNHLSAQRTGQIYAQLPAKENISILENGTFVKYDYANKEVNYTGPGEWMLVYNEPKVHMDLMQDSDFAMKKEDYSAKVYSPVTGESVSKDSRYYHGHTLDDLYYNKVTGKIIDDATYSTMSADDAIYGKKADYVKDVNSILKSANPYVIDSTDHPYTFDKYTKPEYMKAGTNMVPRVFKTNVGDIFTTNAIANEISALVVGDNLKVGDDGILIKGADDKMQWQVVKIYTLPDRQPAVKIMRVI